MNSDKEKVAEANKVIRLPILWNIIVITVLGTGFAGSVLWLNVTYPAYFGEAAWAFVGVVFGMYITIIGIVGRLYFKQLGEFDEGD